MTSIAVVVLDTVRKDYFDEFFDWLPGLRFNSAYSTSNWTGPAHASLFTGKYGSSVGVSSKATTLDCDRPVLAETLAEAGYKTRGWSTNTNASHVQHFDRGFDEFAGPSDLQSGEFDILDTAAFASKHSEIPRYRRYAQAVYETVVGDYDTLASLLCGYKAIRGMNWELIPDDGASVVRQRAADLTVGADEFLFVNLIEAHTPYFPPQDYRDFNEPVDTPFGTAYLGVEYPELTKQGYRSAVDYLGDIYKKVFGHLSEKFDYVITLSDHGELLGEHHDMWNHVSGIYPELTHIPLVISGEGLTGTTDTLVSIIDLYDTILYLADVDGLPSEGRIIVPPPSESHPYLAEYRGPFEGSLERSAECDFDLEQYDRDLFALIEPGYYGYEDYDGWKEQGECRRNDPPEFLHRRVSELDMDSIEPQDTEFSESTKSRLEDLGYI